MSKRSGCYEFDLDDQLQTCVSGFQSDRQQHWEAKLETEEWSPLKDLHVDADNIAKLIRSRAFALQNIGELSEVNAIYRTLTHSLDAAREEFARDTEEILLKKGFPRRDIEEILKHCRTAIASADDIDLAERGDEPARLVWERLCIDDAWEVVSTIRGRVHRVLELERVVRDALGTDDVPKPCVEFLALVSRCYVYDFVPECAAMCRSAVEQAFKAKITEQHCVQAGQRPTRHGYTLGARIEAAFHPANQLPINPVLSRTARQVRDTGDTAVHKDPRVAKDALGTIKNALLLIDALSRLPDSIDE